MEAKYFTSFDYNKFTSGILHAKIKQKELVSKLHISNLIKNSDLNTKLATWATRAELNVEQDKIAKLEVFDLQKFKNI